MPIPHVARENTHFRAETAEEHSKTGNGLRLSPRQKRTSKEIPSHGNTGSRRETAEELLTGGAPGGNRSRDRLLSLSTLCLKNGEFFYALES